MSGEVQVRRLSRREVQEMAGAERCPTHDRAARRWRRIVFRSARGGAQDGTVDALVECAAWPFCDACLRSLRRARARVASLALLGAGLLGGFLVLPEKGSLLPGAMLLCGGMLLVGAVSAASRGPAVWALNAMAFSDGSVVIWLRQPPSVRD